MLNVGKGNSTNLDLWREIGTIRVLHRSQPKAQPTVTAEEVQAALASARQSAVIAERNRLAGEIHDGLAQIFTVICIPVRDSRSLNAKHPGKFSLFNVVCYAPRFDLR